MTAESKKKFVEKPSKGWQGNFEIIRETPGHLSKLSLVGVFTKKVFVRDFEHPLHWRQGRLATQLATAPRRLQ